MTKPARKAPPAPAKHQPEPPSIGPRASVKAEFARRLQQKMLAHKPIPMSQADLARASQCGRDAVSTYVRGISLPNPKALKKIADALGCDPGDLIPDGMAPNDDAQPAFQVRQVAGSSDRVWITVNQSVSKDQASQITAILFAAKP
jgi:transcriptional regulator with XRE-family HTH domain